VYLLEVVCLIVMRKTVLALVVGLSSVVCGALNIDLVVSLCHEQRVHFVDTLRHTLAADGNNTVASHVYCKCGVRKDFPECLALPNHGREGHTYLHHMQSAPRSADYTMYVNGGLASKDHAIANALKIASVVATPPPGLRYVDHGHTHIGDPTVQRVDETSQQFLERAHSECGDAECCTLCKTHCCALFGMVCPSATMMSYRNQTGCKWGGTTAENSKGLETLESAEPANYPTWIQTHWGIEYGAMEDRQWSPLGLFAVSTHAVQELNRASIATIRAHLERSESGGMTGHYLERSWRSLFTITPTRVQ